MDVMLTSPRIVPRLCLGRITRHVLIVTLIALCGCASMGTNQIEPDRLEYGEALAQSWKNQILLNIVRIRYADAPVFIDVTQIIGGYSIEHTGGASYGLEQVIDPRAWLSNFGVSAGTKYIDRPTITYRPLTGPDYVRNTMMPIHPKMLLMLMEVGWPADRVFAFGVQRINGIDNRLAMRGTIQKGDPAFAHLLHLLREAQGAGAVGLRILKEGDQEVPTFEFREQGVSAEILAVTKEIRELLKLDPDASLYKVVFGGVAADGTEVSIRTRSMLQALIALASYIDVPQKDVDEGRAWPAPASTPAGQPHIRVHCGIVKPTDAFAAVKYRGRWFWVEDTDAQSKPSLSFVTTILTVIQPTEKEMPTVLTVSAN